MFDTQWEWMNTTSDEKAKFGATGIRTRPSQTKRHCSAAGAVNSAETAQTIALYNNSELQTLAYSLLLLCYALSLSLSLSFKHTLI